MLALLVVPLAAAWVLLRSEPGTAWLLERVPAVEVSKPYGALLGERFGAAQLRLHLPAGVLEIDDLALAGARWGAWPGPGVWASLEAESLRARRVHFVGKPAPASSGPPSVPRSLRLPVHVAIERIGIDELQIDALPPLRALSAQLRLGGEGGREHRLNSLQFDWDRLHGSGQVSMAADAPYDTKAHLQAQSTSGMVWQADADIQGPLAALELTATLRGQAAAGKPAPALDARVALRPFAPWPLGTLEATTRDLDLSALASGLPTTRIDGHATVASRGTQAPVDGDIELENRAAGRWNEARIPLQQVRLSLRANAARPSRIEIDAFDFRFADAQAPAGQWRGRGMWEGNEARIESNVTDLQLNRLDARAASMRLSGPLSIKLRHLPSPDPAAVAPPGGIEAIAAELEGRLQGPLVGAPQPVSLDFNASVSAQDVQLRSLRAAAGDAVAQASARLQLQAGQRWQLQSKGQLERFDPAAWFPGPQGSAWRRGPHRLSGTWALDLAMPRHAATRAPAQWLQTLQGNGTLRVVDSLLAGVPAQGELTLRHDSGAAASGRSQLQGSFQLATARLVLEGRGDPLGDGHADHWRGELHAPSLTDLAPLFALHPDLVAWQPRKGSLEMDLSVDGRWPTLRTEGQVTAHALQAGKVSLASASGKWRVDTGETQVVDVQGDLTQVGFGEQSVESMRGEIRGTLGAHKLSLDLAAALEPPPLLVQIFGLRKGNGTQLQVRGDGGWSGEPGGGGTWRGQLQRLGAGVWDRDGAPANPDTSWLETSDFKTEIRFDANARPLAVATPSGRATLAGGMVLRWSDFRWRADSAKPEFAIQAQIEPVTVAPLLQRLQSAERGKTQQWAGDLRVAATMDIRAGERFDADIVLQRKDGDLSYADIGSPQWLGLTDARFELAAHDGTWRFTPQFSGRMLGIVTGVVSARTTPQARWPAADAKLEGALTAQVPNLEAWAGWLPPGWRIEGRLTTTAGIGGTLGAPEYTGDLHASGVGLRNLLQGVSLTDGEVQAVLQGETARIERLVVHAGEGTLSAQGNASFGAQPRAQLSVNAERFRVLGRIDRQLVLSGQATMTLQPERLRLDGRLGVDSGLFDISRRDAPGLDDDVQVHRGTEPSMARAEPPPVSAAMRNAAVALEIDLGNKLRLRGRGLDTTLAGQLALSAPGGRLAVNGTVRAENGTYIGYGQKMTIERGRVILAGPLDAARLDILALRPDVDIRVGVLITGTALNPRVRLYSVPDMSETAKLSWLVLGRGPDGLGRTDTALLQRAALALLSGEGEGATDTLIRSIGLDELSVRQSDGDVRETVISLGKQLSKRWYVGYERGVNATTGTWQLIYRIAQRFTLRAQSGLDNSLDLIWTWRFGRP